MDVEGPKATWTLRRPWIALCGAAFLAGTTLLVLWSPWADRALRARGLEARAKELWERGELEAAQRLSLESLNMWSRLPGADSSEAATAWQIRGRILLALDRLDEAADCFGRSITILQAAEDAALLAEGHAWRAQVNLRYDLYHRAEPDLREALRLRRSAAGTTAALLARTWLDLAACLEGQEHFAAADSAGDSALALVDLGHSDSAHLRADALFTKGRLLLRLDRPTEALPYLEESTNELDRLTPAGDPTSASAASELGLCLARLGRLDEAELLLLKAFNRQRTSLGSDHKQTRQTAAHLAELYERWRKPDLFAHYQSLTLTASSEPKE
jgi:tetratricopeptide (TPR) repeat protein